MLCPLVKSWICTTLTYFIIRIHYQSTYPGFSVVSRVHKRMMSTRQICLPENWQKDVQIWELFMIQMQFFDSLFLKIHDNIYMNLNKLWEIEEDREVWHTAVHGSQTVGHKLVTDNNLYFRVLQNQVETGALPKTSPLFGFFFSALGSPSLDSGMSLLNYFSIKFWLQVWFWVTFYG